MKTKSIRKLVAFVLLGIMIINPVMLPIANAAQIESELPEWLPEDAPQPAPGSEIGIVSFAIDENGNAIVIDDFAATPYSTVHGPAGTAAIYWVNNYQVYWAVTSYVGGLISFTGSVYINTTGLSYAAVGVAADGDVGGNIGVESRKGYTNTATLTGVMIDAGGVSVTMPSVSSSKYY